MRCGLSPVVVSGRGYSRGRLQASLRRLPLGRSTSSRAGGLRSLGSQALKRRLGAVALGLGCSAARGIFPDQGLNPCLLILTHWVTRGAGKYVSFRNYSGVWSMLVNVNTQIFCVNHILLIASLPCFKMSSAPTAGSLCSIYSESFLTIEPLGVLQQLPVTHCFQRPLRSPSATKQVWTRASLVTVDSTAGRLSSVQWACCHRIGWALSAESV